MTTASFFDLDNTLMRGSSLYHLGRGLVRHGELSAADLRQFALANMLFRARGSEPPLERLQQADLQVLAGRSVSRLETLTDLIVSEILPTCLFKKSLALLDEARTTTDETWILTAAPQPLAERIADRLRCTGARGTALEVIGDAYTGAAPDGLHHGARKAESIQYLSTQRDIDLASSRAFSDSIHDLPMLTSVGYPVAVNPDDRLRRHAVRQGWLVRDVSARDEIKIVSKLSIGALISYLTIRKLNEVHRRAHRR